MPLQQIVVSPVLGVRRKTQKDSKESRMVSTHFDQTRVSIFEPICAYAGWPHMHHLLSVCNLTMKTLQHLCTSCLRTSRGVYLSHHNPLMSPDVILCCHAMS